MKALLKYITLAILGIVMFVWTSRAALPERPNGGIGGEAVLLGLPLFWWLVERTARDLLGEFKRMQDEIREKGGDNNGSRG
ncbi:MAG: hypothetical protein HDT42_04750 [Ruminococcaceae bacterium]|nr:hypothetical protein [Oscillospiraceae bacterium]